MRAPSAGRFAGRTVAVTGAASGIGRALARRFAAEGARVGLLDADEAGVAAAAAELRAGGAGAIGLRCDVTDGDACGRSMDRIAAELGPVDILVNNAGITHRSPFAETDLRVIHRVMDVNYFGAVHCTHAALPQLIARRGLVVAVSSVAGFAPLLGRTGYAASKHALHGFFDTLRVELEPAGVGVMIACPSFTSTSIERSALGGDGGRPRMAWAPVGGVARPEDVAAAIVDGAAARRRLLVISPLGKASYLVSRLLPRLYSRLMARSQRAAAPAAPPGP